MNEDRNSARQNGFCGLHKLIAVALCTAENIFSYLVTFMSLGDACDLDGKMCQLACLLLRQNGHLLR